MICTALRVWDSATASLHGLEIAHVQYRGGAAPGMQDLVAGHIQLMFAILPLVGPHLPDGKVRPLAVMSTQA
jgi:tripartite-type tricarboxylate transporter receptor subunit TctC